ncbi:D-alanyl-D-alanine dipeptidase [Legionella wadsworthii]|uniref:D-alanyl-D-alanine dipeptidase n=1 Tax=Legionella wadsworthii TaxID=28088 RepID=A0A378LNX4_9GAMM|nr:M15 family metallopeptidase [Legionella wadsworthii]STY28090.1 D-alanyl-D-alanine dipeptidase [Legionella wadsworthii]
MSEYTELDANLLIADPRILAVPVIENHDPMVDIINHPEISYGPSPEIPNNTDYTKMRLTVFEKLKEAQSLLPQGLRFCLYESYRSLSLQKSLFDIRYEKVKNKHPFWSHQEIFIETTRMVSPVINLDGTTNIPPHATGAAIDIYLINDQGIPIEMGIHPKDWMEDVEGTLSLTDSAMITDEAKRNREIMSQALEKVGFVNYPNEYWHWSYGDRYWAYYKQQSFAFYNSYQ